MAISWVPQVIVCDTACEDGAMSSGSELFPFGSMTAALPVFEMALRGYEKRQVDKYVHQAESEISALTAEREEAFAQIAELGMVIAQLEHELMGSRRLIGDDISYRHLGARVEQILALAEEQAAEIRANAATGLTDEERVLRQTRADIDAEAKDTTRDFEIALTTRRADEERAAAKRREDVAMEVEVAKAYAAKIRADVDKLYEAARLESERVGEATKAYAEQVRVETEAHARLVRSQVEAEIERRRAEASRDFDEEIERRHAEATRELAVEIERRQAETARELADGQARARAEADAIIAAARAAADQLVATAHTDGEQIRGQARTDARAEADRIVATARSDSDQTLAKAAADAAATRAAAQAEADQTLAEAEKLLGEIRTAVETAAIATAGSGMAANMDGSVTDDAPRDAALVDVTAADQEPDDEPDQSTTVDAGSGAVTVGATQR
jgi:hypothetical protein